MEILIPASPGELLDKIAILEIKAERIKDARKLANVRAELAVLVGARDANLDRADWLGRLAAALKSICDVLGMLPGAADAFVSRKKERWLKRQGLAREQVEARLAERNQARKQKKWQEADRIRQELLDKGVMIEDTPSGTEWKIK